MNSHTPRTDAAIEDYGYREECGTWVQQMLVSPGFARKLEKKLTAARATIARLEGELSLRQEGRSNSADGTGVRRFGFDATKLPVDIIPATNGAYVYFEDYRTLYAKLAAKEAELQALKQQLKGETP